MFLTVEKDILKKMLQIFIEGVPLVILFVIVVWIVFNVKNA